MATKRAHETMVLQKTKRTTGKMGQLPEISERRTANRKMDGKISNIDIIMKENNSIAVERIEI